MLHIPIYTIVFVSIPSADSHTKMTARPVANNKPLNNLSLWYVIHTKYIYAQTLLWENLHLGNT